MSMATANSASGGGQESGQSLLASCACANLTMRCIVDDGWCDGLKEKLQCSGTKLAQHGLSVDSAIAVQLLMQQQQQQKQQQQEELISGTQLCLAKAAAENDGGAVANDDNNSTVAQYPELISVNHIDNEIAYCHCQLCDTIPFVFCKQQQQEQQQQQPLSALLPSSAITDASTIKQLRQRASQSWFRVALPDYNLDNYEDSAALLDGEAKKHYSKLEDAYRKAKSRADSAFELKLTKTIEQLQNEHASNVATAQAELRQLRRALLLMGQRQQQQQQQLQSEQQSPPQTVLNEGSVAESALNQPASMPDGIKDQRLEGNRREEKEEEEFRLDEEDDEFLLNDNDDDAFDGSGDDNATSDKEQEVEEEQEKQQDQQGDYGRCRSGSGSRKSAQLAQSAPVSIGFAGARRGFSKREPVTNQQPDYHNNHHNHIRQQPEISPLAEDVIEMTTAVASSGEDAIRLPDATEFKVMTDAERLYVMRAMSYQQTASVREHDQFGTKGPPYLQQLAEKARRSRHSRRLSANCDDQLLEVSDEFDSDASHRRYRGRDSGLSQDDDELGKDELGPQSRVLRASTMAVDMSASFHRL